MVVLRAGAPGAEREQPETSSSIRPAFRRRFRSFRRTTAIFLLILFALLLLLARAFLTIPHLPSWLLTLPKPFPFVLRRALRWYIRQLHYLPLATRAVSAGIIFFCADLSAQLLHAAAAPAGLRTFSFARVARYSFYGFMFMGPFLFLWYSLMNEYGPEDDFRGSLEKCLFEQFTLEPFCIAMYICYDGLVCRRGLRATYEKLITQLGPLWFKNAVFWLPANFANYYIGTPDMRVLFANLCSLFWNIYFSLKVNALLFVAQSAPSLPLHSSTANKAAAAAESKGLHYRPQLQVRTQEHEAQQQRLQGRQHAPQLRPRDPEDLHPSGGKSQPQMLLRPPSEQPQERKPRWSTSQQGWKHLSLELAEHEEETRVKSPRFAVAVHPQQRRFQAMSSSQNEHPHRPLMAHNLHMAQQQHQQHQPPALPL